MGYQVVVVAVVVVVVVAVVVVAAVVDRMVAVVGDVVVWLVVVIVVVVVPRVEKDCAPKLFPLETTAVAVVAVADDEVNVAVAVAVVVFALYLLFSLSLSLSLSLLVHGVNLGEVGVEHPLLSLHYYADDFVHLHHPQSPLRDAYRQDKPFLSHANYWTHPPLHDSRICNVHRKGSLVLWRCDP